MQTVASHAGVSRMAVSLALRNHPSLPLATRQRLRSLARKLGYRPNPMISALMGNLRRRRSGTYRPVLALLLSHSFAVWMRHPGMRRCHEAARRRAEELGYRLEPFWLHEPGMSMGSMNRILRTRQISGVLVAPLLPGTDRIDLDWAGLTSVVLGASLPGFPVHRVVNNHLHTIRLALEQVARRGYRRIGLALPAEVHDRVRKTWLAGYLAFHYPARRPCGSTVLIAADWSEPVFTRWARSARPDAILTSDARALDWLGGLSGRGSHGIGVAHLDLTEPGRELAGVDQRWDLIGQTAVEVVTAHLQRNERGLPASPLATLIEGVWVEGRSLRRTRPPRV